MTLSCRRAWGSFKDATLSFPRTRESTRDTNLSFPRMRESIQGMDPRVHWNDNVAACTGMTISPFALG